MCTALFITDTNGNGYKGRTWELSFEAPDMITYLPAGEKIESTTPSGAIGKTFITKYPILGISLSILAVGKHPNFTEAMNDQGLTISQNGMGNSSLAPVGNDNSKILAASDFSAWVLGSFKNVAETKAALGNDEIELWLPTIEAMGPFPFPVHYAIWDKSGAGIVVEFMNGKTNVYDNPVNVLANYPEFPWHLENLNNYTFTNEDKNEGKIGSLNLSTPDSGIALTALPSSQTSQGRFVRAAFYANYVRKANSADAAIVTLGHIMNNFDRPYDLTTDTGGGMADGPRASGISTEYSSYTVLNDLAGKRFFYRGIDALNWIMIDMNDLAKIKQTKLVPTAAVNKAGIDVTNLFTSA